MPGVASQIHMSVFCSQQALSEILVPLPSYLPLGISGLVQAGVDHQMHLITKMLSGSLGNQGHKPCWVMRGGVHTALIVFILPKKKECFHNERTPAKILFATCSSDRK